MFKFNFNSKYTTIAAYVCIVIAITVVILMIGLNFQFLNGIFASFLGAISPIIYGLVIAYICNPMLNFCERHLFPRSKRLKPSARRALSIVLTYFVYSLMLLLFALLVVPQIVSSYNDLQSKFPQYLVAAEEWADGFIARFPLLGDKYSSFADFVEANQVTERIKDIISNSYEHIKALTVLAVDFGGKFVSTISRTLIGIILSFYFLFYKEKSAAFLKKMMSASLPKQKINRVFSITAFTHKIFGRFILGKMLDSLIIGILTFIVLAIFKMPFYPLVSVIIGVTNIIPFFGPFIGAIPSAFIILIADPVKAFWFLVIILIIQQLDGNVIGPRIIGDTTGLSSVWVLVAVIVMGAWLGVLGMFIGVPLFALIYHFIKRIIEKLLEKKGLPIETSAYYDTDNNEDNILREEEST